MLPRVNNTIIYSILTLPVKYEDCVTLGHYVYETIRI